MRIKNVFFDFDGVLAESVHVKTQAYYDMYIPFGDDIARKVVEHHRANGGMSRFEKFRIYHSEYLGESIDDKKVNELAEKYSKLVVHKVINSPEIHGASYFLNKYKNELKYWIITGTPTNEIEEITAKRNIRKYYIELCGSPTKKWEWTEYLIGKYGLNRNETLFLGDAMSDFKAAEISKLHFALRHYKETFELFKDYDVIRFTDFYDLEKKINFK